MTFFSLKDTPNTQKRLGVGGWSTKGTVKFFYTAATEITEKRREKSLFLTFLTSALKILPEFALANSEGAVESLCERSY